jgi:hypothetical protein
LLLSYNWDLVAQDYKFIVHGVPNLRMPIFLFDPVLFPFSSMLVVVFRKLNQFAIAFSSFNFILLEKNLASRMF